MFISEEELKIHMDNNDYYCVRCKDITSNETNSSKKLCTKCSFQSMIKVEKALMCGKIIVTRENDSCVKGQC